LGVREVTDKLRPYVAYDWGTGIPWAAGYDREKIFAYAEKHGLKVLDVDPTDEEPEWEYVIISRFLKLETLDNGYAPMRRTREEAEAEVARLKKEFSADNWRLARRRKAGPWEKVEG
jgi:hypothetical protein